MLKPLRKHRLWKRGPTHTIEALDETPPITEHVAGILPEIRVQAEEPSISSISVYDPAAPLSCPTCSPLTACKEQPVMKTNLLRATEAGCASCSLLWKASAQVPDFDQFDFVSTWSGNGGIFGLCLGKDGIEDADGSDQSREAVVILASNEEKSRSPFPWLPSIDKSPFTRNSLRDTRLLSSWINECQATHFECQQTLYPILPSRVIDVGSDTAEPFLKVTQGETGRYVALSHRWGALNAHEGMLVTKREDVEQFSRGIPFASFPLTFRHAIEVTRSLEIRHLWIDALCIVQDDIRDWETQAARMGDIYENAYATLFAERASNCNAGLFQTERDKKTAIERVQEIEYRNPQTNQQHWILMSFGLSYFPNDIQEAFCLADKPNSHLENRGWIMQEEILSFRKICFSETELYWQCKSMCRCECGLKSTNHTAIFAGTDLTKNLLLTERLDGSSTRGLSSASSTNRRRTTDVNKSGKKLVEIYTQRILTNEQDRLSALAGVASKLERPPRNYLAGIWLDDAADQLLWRGWTTAESSCHRREQYCAPSFSWASIEGRIQFCSLEDQTENIWKVIGGSCRPSGENPMGPVSSGMLRIRSKVAAVLVEECEGPPEANISEYGGKWSGFGISEQVRDGKLYHLKLRHSIEKAGLHDSLICLDTDDDWKQFAGKKAEQCLYIVAQRGTSMGKRMLEERTHTIGLLVRESTMQKGCWERVCLCVPGGRWKDWRNIVEDREIIIV